MRESERAWKKKNTMMIAFRLQRSTDADLVAYFESKEGSRQGEIKRLLRKAIAAEQNQ